MAAPVPDRPTAPRFHRSFRGYAPDAVDVFLTRTRERLDELAAENRLLQERAERLAQKVAYHEERGIAVQDALVMAQTVQREMRESAAAEADRIRLEATSDADEIVQRAHQELAKARAEAAEMQRNVSGLREGVTEEIRELRRTAREEAETEADRIRDEAQGEAARILEEARLRVEELSAQVRRLEERRAAFLHLVQELNALADESRGTSGDSVHEDPQPVNLYFHG